MDEHRGHDTVSAAAERTEKQKQLGVTQSKLQQRIQEREKELQDLRQAVQAFKSCQSVCAPPGPGDLPGVTGSPHVSFEAVKKICI
uniref:TRIM8/14/16/25/29/45/65 coiled-coil region domain-containing protein n=1 Tax=Anguilla anguilla TaxID=7936 RepID=A0A0E9QBJ2_ANGAN